MPVLFSESRHADGQPARRPSAMQRFKIIYREKKCTHTNMCTRTHTETSTHGQLHVPEHTGTYQPANHKVLVFLFCFVFFFFFFCFVFF